MEIKELGRCFRHGKIRYARKKWAKDSIRHHGQSGAMGVYRCTQYSGSWHVGHPGTPPQEQR